MRSANGESRLTVAPPMSPTDPRLGDLPIRLRLGRRKGSGSSFALVAASTDDPRRPDPDIFRSQNAWSPTGSLLLRRITMFKDRKRFRDPILSNKYSKAKTTSCAPGSGRGNQLSRLCWGSGGERKRFGLRSGTPPRLAGEGSAIPNCYRSPSGTAGKKLVVKYKSSGLSLDGIPDPFTGISACTKAPAPHLALHFAPNRDLHRAILRTPKNAMFLFWSVDPGAPQPGCLGSRHAGRHHIVPPRL